MVQPSLMIKLENQYFMEYFTIVYLHIIFILSNSLLHELDIFALKF